MTSARSAAIGGTITSPDLVRGNRGCPGEVLGLRCRTDHGARRGLATDDLTGPVITHSKAITAHLTGLGCVPHVLINDATEDLPLRSFVLARVIDGFHLEVDRGVTAFWERVAPRDNGV